MAAPAKPRKRGRNQGAGAGAEPVDLPRARKALAALDALAAAHPELRGPRGPENIEGWRATLEEHTMQHDSQFALRLPANVVAGLDALAERLRSQHPGVKFSRADVTRMLIVAGLEREGIIVAPVGGESRPEP